MDLYVGYVERFCILRLDIFSKQEGKRQLRGNSRLHVLAFCGYRVPARVRQENSLLAFLLE
jgi:hypothetical protein